MNSFSGRNFWQFSSISWGENRRHRRNLWGVRVMTVDALIPEAGSPGEVPVAVHSTVTTVIEGAALGAVALGAQAQGIDHRECFARREVKL